MNIQILPRKEDQKLSATDAMKVKYHEVKDDEWKVKLVREIIEVKQGTLDAGLENSEIGDILEHLRNPSYTSSYLCEFYTEGK